MASNMKKLFSIAAVAVCSALSLGQTIKRFGDMQSWDNVVTGVSQIESNIAAVSNDTVAIRSLIGTNCATKADATITPIYRGGTPLSNWVFDDSHGRELTVSRYNTDPVTWKFYDDTTGTEYPATVIEGSYDVPTKLRAEVGYDIVTATRTWNTVIGYQLGSQTNLLLQPAGDYDTTLTPVYSFSPWSITPASVGGNPLYLVWKDEWPLSYSGPGWKINGDDLGCSGLGTYDSTSLTWGRDQQTYAPTVTATREKYVIGYTLGSQTNKLLASYCYLTNSTDKVRKEVPGTVSNVVTKAFVENLGISGGGDTTMTPVYSASPVYGNTWTCSPALYDGKAFVISRIPGDTVGGTWELLYNGSVVSSFGNTNSTTASINVSTTTRGTIQTLTATRNRTDIIGYVVGTNTTAAVASLQFTTNEIEKISQANNIWRSGEGYGSAVLSAGEADYTNEAYGRGSLAHGSATVARGFSGHAEGMTSETEGDYSHAEGFGSYTDSSAMYSHAEGNSATFGEGAHSEGQLTAAYGQYSHTEGFYSETGSDAENAHAEGHDTRANGPHSHSEGRITYAISQGSHSEGDDTTAGGAYSHSSGFRSVTAKHGTGAETSENHDYAYAWQGRTDSGYYHSHGPGTFNLNPVGGLGGLWIGEDTLANILLTGTVFQYSTNLSSVSSKFRYYGDTIESHAIGQASVAIGEENKAYGDVSFAFGSGNIASNSYAVASGNNTLSSGEGSHSEGFYTSATGDYSHSEGAGTKSSGYYSHSEGAETTASGESSHAEGDSSTASGNYSHAEGYHTIASGESANASGYMTKATGDNAHAEGSSTEASGYAAHAEGDVTVASGDVSHAGGEHTVASGHASYAIGTGTTSSNLYAFTWRGLEYENPYDETPHYGSHGPGTFNISPVGGTSGFWIGNTNLATILSGVSVQTEEVYGERNTEWRIFRTANGETEEVTGIVQYDPVYTQVDEAVYVWVVGPSTIYTDVSGRPWSITNSESTVRLEYASVSDDGLPVSYVAEKVRPLTGYSVSGSNKVVSASSRVENLWLHEDYKQQFVPYYNKYWSIPESWYPIKIYFSAGATVTVTNGSPDLVMGPTPSGDNCNGLFYGSTLLCTYVVGKTWAYPSGAVATNILINGVTLDYQMPETTRTAVCLSDRKVNKINMSDFPKSTKVTMTYPYNGSGNPLLPDFYVQVNNSHEGAIPVELTLLNTTFASFESVTVPAGVDNTFHFVCTGTQPLDFACFTDIKSSGGSFDPSQLQGVVRSTTPNIWIEKSVNGDNVSFNIVEITE